jgi:hypothetical protein
LAGELTKAVFWLKNAIFTDVIAAVMLVAAEAPAQIAAGPQLLYCPGKVPGPAPAGRPVGELHDEVWADAGKADAKRLAPTHKAANVNFGDLASITIMFAPFKIID